MHIGVLALQGDFEKHQHFLNNLGTTTDAIRYPDQLKKCHALIIPGGESTTLTKQIEFSGMRQPLLEFAEHHSIFGTCAGLIMLGADPADEKVKPLNILPLKVNRNGWGRQVHSFTDNVNLEFDSGNQFEAAFIRAPRIIWHNGLNILAMYKSEPVLVSNGRHLAATFHPELGQDERIHKFFLEMVND